MFELTPESAQFLVEIRIFFGGVADRRFAELLIDKAEETAPA